MAGEGEPPQPRIEARVLARLGLEDYLDAPVYGFNLVTGSNFLDAYPAGSDHRGQTADILYAFDAMSESDPDYPATRDLLLANILPAFRPPQEV